MNIHHPVGSIVYFPTHESPKSKQRLGVKNSFNQDVPNLFAFGTTSIYVLPTTRTLMAQILEPATKLKPLTASSQPFLQQAVQWSGRYFAGDHHQPVSLCSRNTLWILQKSSAGTRELYQHPSCGKSKPIAWGREDVVHDLTSGRRQTTLLSCRLASGSSTQKQKGFFQEQAEKSQNWLPLQELKLWIHLSGSQKLLDLKYEHPSGKDPASQTK